ncbi:MAG: hypothetical protein JSU01_19915 [Bacteroidetes bacterium]|nr:hypothetical protein [Bacteroidota bacterium]
MMKCLVYAAFIILMPVCLASCKAQSRQYAKQSIKSGTYVQGGYSAVHDRPPIN